MPKNQPSLMAASPGDRFTYSHPDGLGYGAHNKDKSGFGELSAEMTELDLKDGMEVTFIDFDEETGWPIVSWTDATGISRNTTIEEQYIDLFPAA